MRRILLAVLATALLLMAPLSAPASLAGPGAACKTVVKVVHGKRKRVRVCSKPSLPQAANAVARIPLEGDVVSVTAGGGAIWATTEDDRLFRVDPATNAVVATILLPDSEWVGAVTFGEGAAWVTVPSPDTETKPELDSVLRIDPKSNTVVARIPVGRSPEGVATTPGAVWTANHRSDAPPAERKPQGMFSVSRVDVSTNRETARPTVESRQRSDLRTQFCCGPSGMTAAAGSVWTAVPTDRTLAGFVVRLDPAASSVVATIPMTDAEACGGMSGDDAGIWVAAGCDDFHVTRIDPATNRIAATVALTGVATDVAIGLGAVWVATDRRDNGSGVQSLTRVDPTTNKVVGRTRLARPRAVAVGMGSVWVGAGNSLVRLTP